MASSRDAAQYLRGAACGLGAVCIWSGWIVVARLGLRSSMTPGEIAAIRFAVAGALLLPLVITRGLAIDRLGWLGLAAIVFGGAAPVFLANSGLLFASRTCRRAVSRRHAVDGSAAGGSTAGRGIHGGEEVWLCLYPGRCDCDRLGFRQRVGI